MTNLKLKLAQPEDAEALQSLCKQTFYDTFTGTCTEEDMKNYLIKTFPLSRIQQEITDPASKLLLLFDESTLIGYAKLGHQTIPELKAYNCMEIERLYVAQSHIGKGAGALLMQACLQQALFESAELIYLGVWEHNYRAQKFYSKYGFEVFGEHPFPIESTPQTDLWMKLDVKKIPHKLDSVHAGLH